MRSLKEGPGLAFFYFVSALEYGDSKLYQEVLGKKCIPPSMATADASEDSETLTGMPP